MYATDVKSIQQTGIHIGAVCVCNWWEKYSTNLNSNRCSLLPMWITPMWHRLPLYNRCEMRCFQTTGSHIKSATTCPMWFDTYHNGSLPDVKSEWHTTSPLVTSVATRCEMSVSTDVKCHFCSSVVRIFQFVSPKLQWMSLNLNHFFDYMKLWSVAIHVAILTLQ